MKNIKSSRVFENLKPSEEQKKVIYNSIKNEIVKNNNDIIVENNGVEIIKRKKINIKSALYPSLAAAVLIIVFAATIPGLKNNDFKAGKKHSADVTGTESSEIKVDNAVFDSSMSYTAELVSDDLYGFIGSHDGKFYCSKINQVYESAYGRVSDYPFEKKIVNENGLNYSMIEDVISNDKIYISGFDSENHYSVCAYNKDLTKMLFSMYDDNDTFCSLIAQGNDNDSLYAVCSDDKYENDNIQKRNLKDEIICQADLKDYGLDNGYVQDLFVMESGDVAALYIFNDTTQYRVSLMLFDSDLNYITSVISNQLKNGRITLGGNNNELYLANLEYISGEARGSKLLITQDIKIYSVDFENQVFSQQPCEISPLVSEVEHEIDSPQPKYGEIYQGSNGYDFFYANPDLGLYGYKIKERVSEKIQENIDLNIYNIFYVGDELYGTVTKLNETADILSSIYGGDTVFSVEGGINANIKDDIILSDGHIIEWIPVNGGNNYNYTVYDIDPDSGSAETTNINTDHYIYECMIKDEYIVALCIQTDGDHESIINIYNKNGTLLNTINSDKGMVDHLFLTAENKLIATIYNEKTDKYYGAEVDPKTGIMKSIVVSWLKFFTSPYHITGSDGYSAFFICSDGIYSAVEKDDDYICEKIIDFTKIDFPNGVSGGVVCDFAYDRNGNIYLRTVYNKIYMLKEKYN